MGMRPPLVTTQRVRDEVVAELQRAIGDAHYRLRWDELSLGSEAITTLQSLLWDLGDTKYTAPHHPGWTP